MTCGSTGNPLGDLVVGFFSFLGDPIGTIIKMIAKMILSAAISVFGALTTNVQTLPDTTTSKNISSQTQWLVVYLAVGSLLFSAARMAVERRSTAGTTALKGILRVILVSGAATTIAMAASSVADDYSTYLFNAGAQDMLNKAGSCSWDDGVQAFLMLILAFLLLIGGIIHTVLMYIRLGVVILLLGTLPLAAAASMTDWGGGWWRKHIGWLIAWLLYKPAAGLVMYAGAQMLTSNAKGSSGVNERIAGIGVMLLSAVALPALLKLVVPATAALGGASAYSGAMQSAGGALATGARSLGGGVGDGIGVGGGNQGRPGPSGASGSSGGTGSTGAGGSSGAAAASGGGRTGPAAGPGGAGGADGGGGTAAGAGRGAAASGARAAGAGVAAAVTAAQVLGRTASGALDGADGDQGHNPSPHR